MNKFAEKLTEFIAFLSKEEEIIRFKEIEKQLEKNDDIKQKIADLKKLQQKMAIYEYHKNTLPDVVSDEYNRLFNELTDIPLFNEYLNLQMEINEVIQEFTKIIETEINNN